MPYLSLPTEIHIRSPLLVSAPAQQRPLEECATLVRLAVLHREHRRAAVCLGGVGHHQRVR